MCMIHIMAKELRIKMKILLMETPQSERALVELASLLGFLLFEIFIGLLRQIE